MKTLIKVSGATVRYLDQLVFEGLDFDWEEGQQWAIVGDSGKQLTAFLDTLLGRTMVTAGSVSRPFAEVYQKEQEEKGEVHSFRDLIAVVSQQYPFKNKSNLQNFYYQQRFNSMEAEEAVTVREYLSSVEAKLDGYWDIDIVLERMVLKDLEDKSLIKLSNGETRRLAIAAALLKQPKMLLLDQPLTGLDVQTRGQFDQILQDIISSGIHLIMSTHSNEVPTSISHVGVFREKKIHAVLPRSGWREVSAKVEGPDVFDRQILNRLFHSLKNVDDTEIIRLENVNISYSGKSILNNLSWTVFAGEKWQLKGPNGAGKSTLLSLILGENPQAYANDIWLFGRKRGSGESIWDIKKEIGFVAPELSRYFPSNQTCIKVVLSGLFDTMGLFKKVSSAQEKLAMEWLAFFRLEGSGQILLKKMSLEEQRFVLLARALIKQPKLLVLDEASQGMDELQRVLFRKTIDQVCTVPGLSLIYVSHYDEDIPACVDKVFELTVN
ncbi:ATP-binding cassette domain-containing protein [Cecembia lonarensis]|uniref:Xylose import ATP-binding protein XylG n=1 Tax=Cecembia lonarensis (strain CCUG 58316 / KCTC 22772 / LW9) TaxID=1225176 RepID=K1LUB6_CECL9|nr:ATP-binding cassette domain-containing protein [Cecembia lonarensis]EKB47704.1 Xylose import ATP-binding protein XylG [Cecembia lonarensis LW9]